MLRCRLAYAPVLVNLLNMDFDLFQERWRDCITIALVAEHGHAALDLSGLIPVQRGGVQQETIAYGSGLVAPQRNTT